MGSVASIFCLDDFLIGFVSQGGRTFVFEGQVLGNFYKEIYTPHNELWQSISGMFIKKVVTEI